MNSPTRTTISPAWFLGALVFSTVVVAAGVGVNGGRVAAAILWSFAFLCLGLVIGFLFGVPKVVQKADQQEPVGDGYDQRVNTSLEQVSDWLTKGLLGVGLVELKTIPEAIQNAANYIAPALALGEAVGAPFVAALIVAFFIQGFLTGYLVTRLHLSGLFRAADQGPTSEQREQLAAAKVLPAGEGRAIPDDVVRVAERFAWMPLDEVQVADVAVWAKAQLIQGNLDEALVGYRRALQLHPGDARMHLEYATVLFRANRKAEALKELEALRATVRGSKGDELIEQVYAWTTYIWLFEPEPQGFEEALKYCKEYLALDVAPRSAEVLVNLAAAYGQKATWLAASGSVDPALLAEIRKEARDALERALTVSPAWRTRLRQLMYSKEPGRGPDDTDLQSFEALPEFRQLLGPPPT